MSIEARERDFFGLKENIWQIVPDGPTSRVETPSGVFEIATPQALAFLRIRSHCTPHNSVAAIGAKSGVATTEVRGMLKSVAAIEMLVGAEEAAAAELPAAVVHARLERVIALWSRELARTFVGNALFDADVPKTVLTGWLLETYHYVRDFPRAIETAAQATAPGPLKALLVRYANEERGHEHFVLGTLVNIGLSEAEVLGSRPLGSTRLIGFLMRELFAAYPAAALAVAALIEAQEVAPQQVERWRVGVEGKFQLPPGALLPYVEHQALDARLGHCRLLADHGECFDITDRVSLDEITDKIHDLKHAFDLQALEIRDYYGAAAGRYLPRQPMTFAAT